MTMKLIRIFALIFAGGAAFAQSPDLVITKISRVADKNELKVTVENKSKEPARDVSLKVSALPSRFCVSMHPYEPAKSVIEGLPCGAKPSEIVPTKQTIPIEKASNPVALAWATANAATFDLAPNAVIEQIVKFPASMRGSIDKDAPTVFPVPFAYDNGVFIYARKSFATFEASVFYAVVASSDESQAKTDNNSYLFKHRVTIKLPK